MKIIGMGLAIILLALGASYALRPDRRRNPVRIKLPEVSRRYV